MQFPGLSSLGTPFDVFMERSECLVSKFDGTARIDHCSGFLLVGVFVQRTIQRGTLLHAIAESLPSF